MKHIEFGYIPTDEYNQTRLKILEVLLTLVSEWFMVTVV
jgi:hypothetical protein